MRKVKHPNVKTVTARGKTYLYFDTGAKKDGKPVMVRLPDPSTPQFGQALSQAMASRNRRKEVESALSLPKFVDLYQRSPRFTRMSAGSQRLYNIYLAVLVDQFDKHGANDLERQEMVGLADRRAETPSAANMLIRVTSALYQWGRTRGHVTARPCDDIELFEGGSHEPWPVDLLNAALADEDERVRLPVALMYYTAQRIGDVCKLRWSDIRDGHLHMTQQKTGKPLVIRLHSALAATLNAIPKRGLFIIAKEDGTPYAPLTVRRHIQAWAKKLGYDIVPHGLRKNAVISLLMAGNSVAETASISGQTFSVVEYYAKQLAQETLGSAAILRWEGKK